MNRITERLRELKNDNKKALSLFVTAGYPKPEDTVSLILKLAQNGADMIELGVPFSDPIADGPAIQFSSDIALKNGMTLEKTFQMAGEIRKKSDIPLVLMGYANPIVAFGMGEFIDRCSSIGIDGSIVPDLSLEESKEYRELAYAKDISTIFLAAPTTSPERLKQLDNASRGFLYCVSVTGVTGERKGIDPHAFEFLSRTRKTVTNNPVLVGFGISSPEDAVQLANQSDGVIIGSALVKILNANQGAQKIEKTVDFVLSVREALDIESGI